jgi:hypothetical protein
MAPAQEDPVAAPTAEQLLLKARAHVEREVVASLRALLFEVRRRR